MKNRYYRIVNRSLPVNRKFRYLTSGSGYFRLRILLPEVTGSHLRFYRYLNVSMYCQFWQYLQYKTSDFVFHSTFLIYLTIFTMSNQPLNQDFETGGFSPTPQPSTLFDFQASLTSTMRHLACNGLHLFPPYQNELTK